MDQSPRTVQPSLSELPADAVALEPSLTLDLSLELVNDCERVVLQSASFDLSGPLVLLVEVDDDLDFALRKMRSEILDLVLVDLDVAVAETSANVLKNVN